jgi:5-methylcytosine-specific restriction protein A
LGKLFPSRWSCGRTKSISNGDRLFLLRQDSERGIIGSGYATSDVFEDGHWDSSEDGKSALYVDYLSDTLLPTHERLRVELLLVKLPGVAWNNMMASGVKVATGESQLEALWGQHLSKIGRQTRRPIRYADEPAEKGYSEGAVQEVMVNRYERSPEARAKCLAHYGTCCAVCEFDFATVYGELGEGFIHVHHLRDLAKIGRSYEVNPISDLRPVCPNCHAMLHQDSETLTIDTLREIVRRRRKKVR